MIKKIIKETKKKTKSIKLNYQYALYFDIEKDQFSIAAIGDDNHAHILSVIIDESKKEIYIQEKTAFSKPIIYRMPHDSSVKPDDLSLCHYIANKIADHFITEIRKRNAMNTREKTYQRIEAITIKVFQNLKIKKGQLKISIKDPFDKGIIYKYKKDEYRFWLDWDKHEGIELAIVQNNQVIKTEFIENFSHPDAIEEIKTLIQKHINTVAEAQ